MCGRGSTLQFNTGSSVSRDSEGYIMQRKINLVNKWSPFQMLYKDVPPTPAHTDTHTAQSSENNMCL